MKPKKIAILYAGAANWGGIETYLEQLFINADINRIDMTFVSLGRWELVERLERAGFKTKTFENKWYDFRLANILADFLRSEKFNLVTSQGLVANFYGRLAAKKSTVPSLVTLHSDYKFDYHGLKKYLFWLTFELFEKYTTSYVVVSKFLQREAIKLGVDATKVSVVYNGVKEIRVKPKTRQGSVVFGSLGRLHYKKGYQGLIKAASLIKDLDFKVFIWGSGDDKKDLEDLIKLHGLTDKVFLRGFTKDIVSALNEIDVYIQPSLEEGFGITVAEGMYAQRPVIVTPAGSLPELITDGKTGLITHGFAPEAIATSMKVLIENPELCNRLAKAGHQEALNRFGLDKWILEIEDAYVKAAK